MLCSSNSLVDVLDLGEQPPANSLREDVQNKPRTASLKLIQCQSCSLVQLDTIINPEYLFSKYVWVTSTSSTARVYSEEYCKNLLDKINVKIPFIVEIASNDGTFLNQFKQNGCEVLGVDPTKNIAKKANEDGIPTLAQFFNLESAKKISKIMDMQI